MLPTIWFQLVDAEGKAYRGSTPTSLSIFFGTIVDVFRDAVKNRCPNDLASVDVNKLLVYRTVSDLQKEALPLEEDVVLLPNSLGPKEPSPWWSQQQQKKKSRKSRNIASLTSSVLNQVKWPLPGDLRLFPPKFANNCVHASQSLANCAVAAPNKPDRPSMLLYALDNGGFKAGKPLLKFDAVNDTDKCAVLLAPSGAGKTRKLFELLHEKLGYFIPYKLSGDKNDGSKALSTVLNLLVSDPRMDWVKENPPVSEFVSRVKLAQFAISCVLIAYAEVFRGWVGSDTCNQAEPFKWLLLQLFPEIFLGADVFQILAKSLYESCDPDEIRKYSHFHMDFYCVIDEAQMLGKILRRKFNSRAPVDRESGHRRPVLNPVVYGIKEALGRFPIVAGTGVTLVEEWASVSSCLGVPPDYIYNDFPLLNYEQVLDFLQKFLFVQQHEPVEHAAKWLVGRPRWVTEFVSDMTAENKSIGTFLSEFLNRMTRVNDNTPQPRTLCGALHRLANKSSELAGEETMNPYEAFLQDAYLLSMDATPTPRTSPLLLEMGLGFLVDYFERVTIVKFEPLVLETARVHIEAKKKFHFEFLRSISDGSAFISKDSASLGKRFECVSAAVLMKSFTSQPLENHPLLANTALPIEFTGKWESKADVNLFGKVATSVSTMKDFYTEHFESILFPDQNAGPDAILTLTKPSSNDILTIFIQDKVVKYSKLKGALLTVDPQRLHHFNRGIVAQPASHGRKARPGETAWPGVDLDRAEYLKRLTGPVIRVVVSILDDVGNEERRVQWVPNHIGSKDLLLLIDNENAESVYGKELWEFIRMLRDEF